MDRAPRKGSRRRLRDRGRRIRAAERAAKTRACTQIVLGTHSFQAPAFYAKHGYTVCGEAPDYPNGYAQIHLRKALV